MTVSIDSDSFGRSGCKIISSSLDVDMVLKLFASIAPTVILSWFFSSSSKLSFLGRSTTFSSVSFFCLSNLFVDSDACFCKISLVRRCTLSRTLSIGGALGITTYGDYNIPSSNSKSSSWYDVPLIISFNNRSVTGF